MGIEDLERCVDLQFSEGVLSVTNIISAEK